MVTDNYNLSFLDIQPLSEQKETQIKHNARNSEK